MNVRRTAPATSTSELVSWLRGCAPGDAALFRRARAVLRQYIDEKVRLRGLLEFSNRCACNCRYCGIRSSAPIARFTLSEEEVLEVARVSRDAGYGSMTLQSGERSDRAFTDYVERLVRRIKRETVTSELPRGLGVTLCVGEQSRETFRRFFDAGAHRYLLRIETSDPELFRRLHPPDQPLERRLAALSALKETGFQLGTGVMIGIPGQTAEHLARDIAFFGEVDADMIGMGPYIESAGVADPALDPPLGVAERLRLSLRMIAATRIYLRDVNIAATTALQALSPTGREAGLAAGANVLMPIMTPGSRRADYQLYAGKPCVTEDSVACSACTPFRAARAARGVLWNDWGDAPHAKGAVP